jgi:oligosaccharide repeat unit polymerase
VHLFRNVLQSTNNPNGAMFPSQKQRSPLGKLKYRNQLTVVGLIVMLAINAICYFLGIWQIYWGSCSVILLCTAVPFLVAWRSPLAGYFCFPNIFIALLALFHIGYYVPVRLRWVDGFNYMPPVDSRTGDLAMLLYCCALFSFALGVSCGIFWASRTANWTPLSEKDQILSSKAITRAGEVIIFLNLLLFAVFMVQIGTFDKILRLTYTDYIDFLTYDDPRFLSTFVQFLPIGLLFIYVGLSRRKAVKRILFYLDFTSVAYIGWLALIGARGPAFLFALALLYVRHICYGRLSRAVIAAAAITFLVAIPIIASYRNLPSGERAAAATQAGFDPLASVIEMGATYRTLYAFSAVFGQDRTPLIMGKSYLKAAEQLIPNLGFHKDTSQTSDKYYRSNVWITELIDPIAASQNSGAGSTGIGEPFANFGYFGIVAFFALLGLALGLLEMYSLAVKSVIGAAVLASLLIPVNWYVRDDIYGVARPIIWPLATILITYLFYSRGAILPAKAVSRQHQSTGLPGLSES